METHGRPPRLEGWDYRRAGAYFVTFVVAGRLPVLRDHRGRLTEAGVVVEEVWRRLPCLYLRVQLDELAIMPDHVHAIVWLTDRPGRPVPLGEVVRGWKASSCRQVRLAEPRFGWQSHFHDRVIRSQSTLLRIRRYIRENIQSLEGGRDSSRLDP